MSPPTGTEHRILTPAVLREWELPLADDGGKRSRGTVIVVGGSRRTPGAVLLAGIAALRAGAGTLQLAGPQTVATALGMHAPEALALGLPETSDGAVAGSAVEMLAEFVDTADAVLIGPGLYDAAEAQRLVAGLLARLRPDASAVLDAYALRGLADEVVRSVRGRLVLTPNVREAADLLDRDPQDLGDEGDAATAVAARYGAVVTLHGIVADPTGMRWVDESGHVGLGTSGSGDVLAGVVAGLLARGASPAQAACWGTHVHATAGERLAARIGRVGFLARELLDEVPLVLDELQG